MLPWLLLGGLGFLWWRGQQRQPERYSEAFPIPQPERVAIDDGGTRTLVRDSLVREIRERDDSRSFALGLRELGFYSGPIPARGEYEPNRELAAAFLAAARAWGIDTNDTGSDERVYEQMVRRLESRSTNASPTSGIGNVRRY